MPGSALHASAPAFELAVVVILCYLAGSSEELLARCAGCLDRLGVAMRKATVELLKYYLSEMHLGGKALEIGGHRMAKSAGGLFIEAGLDFYDLNLEKSDIPNTIIADISRCPEIEDNTFDVVFSSDVFEHIAQPWEATKEICRILKPGGLAFTFTLWSWRNHPCPIDYWRYSPECLEFLFSDLHCLEKGYDLSMRRADQTGFWKSGRDSVPVDELGGWRENWAVYHVGQKPPTTAAPKPFKQTTHSQAAFLRMDTQGRYTRDDPRPASASKPAGNAIHHCPSCGVSLAASRCIKCKASMPAGARFCMACGHAANASMG